MESVNLKKGQVHFMDDLLVIEGDGAMNRRRRNILFGLFLLFLVAGYLYTQYEGYVSNPHQFNWFRFLVRVIIIVILIIPSAINRLFRFSSMNEIPYTAIIKHLPGGSLFKWNSSVMLYLSDNKIRILNFPDDGMNQFRSLLDQKLASNNS